MAKKKSKLKKTAKKAAKKAVKKPAKKVAKKVVTKKPPAPAPAPAVIPVAPMAMPPIDVVAPEPVVETPTQGMPEEPMAGGEAAEETAPSEGALGT